MPISETNMSDWKASFRYRKCSDIDITVHSDIRHWRKKNTSTCRSEPMTLRITWERYTFKLLWLYIKLGMSDKGYRIKLYSDIDIMSDSTLSVRYRRFRYQAQSDIADHGYRTKCPPMVIGYSDSVVWPPLRQEFYMECSWPEPVFMNKMKRRLERYLFEKWTFQMGFLNTCQKDVFSRKVKEECMRSKM